MSHPLLVEAAETAFVPLCIYNNTGGDQDERVRERYDEPAWNNPVVRIVNESGADVVPRLANDWSLAALTGRLTRALEAKELEVPRYLELLREEADARSHGTEVAVFGMH